MSYLQKLATLTVGRVASISLGPNSNQDYRQQPKVSTVRHFWTGPDTASSRPQFGPLFFLRFLYELKESPLGFYIDWPAALG
jgi:hypothetical protein